MKKRNALILLAALIFALTTVSISPHRAQAQFPSQFGAQRFPAIDVDKNDKLYLAISTATGTAAEMRPHSQIFFASSGDGGTNWSNFPQTKNLTKSKGEAFGPSLVVTKKGTPRAYIAYHDDSPGVTEAFLLRAKKKAKFKKPEILTPGGGGGFAPRIALDSNEALNIVYGDTTGGARRVQFMRSEDLGATFSESLLLSGSSTQSFEPEITVDPDDAINVAWADEESGAGVIMFSRSINGGATFSDPVAVSKGTGSATQAHITSDSAGHLHIVYMQQLGEEEIQVFYTRSADHGQTFSEPVNISNKSEALVNKPLVATFEDSTVYVAFQNEVRRDQQIYLLKSEDGGLTFSEPKQVSNANNQCGRAHSAAMVVDSEGTLHLVWIDASRVQGCSDEGILFYSNSKDGRRFSTEKMILSFI
ncbi:MAG TPA: sialidase family protein [Blastocatellia bacterium]|nr:sialidase family protein [Blastocatellia bacterium]